MASSSNVNTELISETEVRNYLLQNGGIVRNNDIVTYFRAYLANPVIRDEARAIFKSIVNKLATVKVENGEKFLVLKRQYFPPIDGNGNNDGVGLPQASSSYGRPVVLPPSVKTTIPSVRTAPPQAASYQQSQGYEYNQNIKSQQSAPVVSSNPYNFNPYSYQVPPPYIPSATANYTSQQQQYYAQQQQPQSQLLSKSQPSLYGSNFSLISNSNSSVPPAQSNSNYPVTNNAYLNTPNYTQSSSVLFNNNENYPPEYGLPTVPPSAMTTSPPRRLSFTASSGSPLASALPYGLQQQPSFERQGVPSGRTPPPYRPPPPAQGNTPPSSVPGAGHGPRMSPVSLSSNYYRSPPPSTLAYQPPRQSSMQGYGHGQESVSVGSSGQGFHQYQRSLSGPGNLTSTVNPCGGVRSNTSTSSTVSSPSSPGTVAFLHAATTLASTVVTGGNSYSSSDGVPAPPVPPRFKRGSSSSNSPNSETSINRSIATMSNSEQDTGISPGNEMERDSDDNNDKENTNPHNMLHTTRSRSASLPNGSDMDDLGSISSHPNGNGNSDDTSEESEQKISVKERMQKFNRIASESELGKLKNNNNANKGKTYVQELDDDTTSLSSYGFGYANTEPRAREWILKAATRDYHGLNKMALEIPSLVKRKDVNYTALHWAAKHGDSDLIKLLAGTFKSDMHSKTNGGYTPLHLAAQFGRHEAYELLIKVYNADPNIRDHSGKKPMQYLVRQDTTVSMDTFKKIKEKRRSTESQRERDSSFLRIGSLNVRVKKTTEAFGNFLGKSTSSSSIERMINKSWGSADSLQDSFDNSAESDRDKEMMPPPNGNVVLRGSVSSSSSKDKRSRSRRSLQSNDSSSSVKHNLSSSDSEESDTACGFGSDWKNP